MTAPAPAELPVALFAYRRPAELAETLAGLERAGFRRITAFSEAPGSPEEEPLVEQVRELLAAVCWADVELVEREEHLGLSRSIRAGLDELFSREQRAVVIEDDIVVAPEFGRFVASALERYAGEERVAGVTGLREPFSRRWLRGYRYDAFMLPRFLAWGWATWAPAWRTFDFDGDRLLERLRGASVQPQTGGADLAWMFRRTFVDRTQTGAWDVYCMASMLLNDQLFVCPTWNMVENVGLETGTHLQSSRWRHPFEPEHRPADLDRLRWPPAEVAPRIAKGFQILTENPQGWTLRRLVPRPLRNVARRVRRTYEV